MKKGILPWLMGLLFGLGMACGQSVELEDGPLVGGLEDLKTLDQKLIEMSGRCVQATVALVAKSGGGSGSGVVVSSDGLVLTAAHVVEAMRGGVVVIFPDGTRKAGKVLGGEFDRDGAMVQITDEGEYPFVEVAGSDSVMRNQWCVAMGHPGGFDPARTPPIRLGRVISAGPFIVTDCAVVGGDSGGPLFDVEGRLIGIHSNIGATLSQNRHVPLSVFRSKWDDMKAGVREGSRFGNRPPIDPDRPVIGVQLGDPSKKGGVVVTGVMDGSPAAKAGLKEGDVIQVFAGKKVNRLEQIVEAASSCKPGQKVRVVFRRDGKKQRAQLKLVRMADLMGGVPERESRRGAPDETPNKKAKEPKKGGKDAEAQASLEEMLKRSLEKGGRLELTPDQLEELGGREALAAKLRELMAKLSPEEMAELAKRAESMEAMDPFFASVVKALEPVVGPLKASTVSVLADGEVVALGTVVSKDGWILTKNLETEKGALSVQVGDKTHDAELIERFPVRDLALLSIDAKGLKPVRWAKPDFVLPLGSLLASSSPDGGALGIGVISVMERAFEDVGFLGIRSEEHDAGVRVADVVPDSSAAKSGLKKGDVIIELEGEAIKDPLEFGKRVRGLKAGDELRFRYQRGDKVEEAQVKLGARPQGPSSDRFRRMNEMAGPLSRKVSGYPEALQHDMPLSPDQCGGPVVDLEGRCVGINVSRAGRVKTLAIPADDVLRLLERVEEERLNDADLEAVRDLIEEMQDNLEELKGRLKELEAR